MIEVLKLPWFGLKMLAWWGLSQAVMQTKIAAMPRWEKDWRKIEEYWDLKALIGADFYDQLPVEERARIDERYYALVDDIGKYVDVCNKPPGLEESRERQKELVEAVRTNKMTGRHNIWPMVSADPAAIWPRYRVRGK